jgi:hypothetical protein
MPVPSSSTIIPAPSSSGHQPRGSGIAASPVLDEDVLDVSASLVAGSDVPLVVPEIGSVVEGDGVEDDEVEVEVEVEVDEVVIDVVDPVGSDASSGTTHVPAMPAGACSAKRMLDGQSGSGRLRRDRRPAGRTHRRPTASDRALWRSAERAARAGDARLLAAVLFGVARLLELGAG